MMVCVYSVSVVDDQHKLKIRVLSSALWRHMGWLIRQQNE